MKSKAMQCNASIRSHMACLREPFGGSKCSACSNDARVCCGRPRRLRWRIIIGQLRSNSPHIWSKQSGGATIRPTSARLRPDSAFVRAGRARPISARVRSTPAWNRPSLGPCRQKSALAPHGPDQSLSTHEDARALRRSRSAPRACVWVHGALAGRRSAGPMRQHSARVARHHARAASRVALRSRDPTRQRRSSPSWAGPRRCSSTAPSPPRRSSPARRRRLGWRAPPART